MTAKYPAIFLFGLGVLLGVAIWLFSPWITGKTEPWDADAPIWLISWVLVAVAGGLTGHLRGVCLPLGYAVGQMLVTAKPVLFGDLRVLALGWMFIFGYAAVAIVATLLVAGATVLFKRLLHVRSSTDGDA